MEYLPYKIAEGSHKIEIFLNDYKSLEIFSSYEAITDFLLKKAKEYIIFKEGGEKAEKCIYKYNCNACDIEDGYFIRINENDDCTICYKSVTPGTFYGNNVIIEPYYHYKFTSVSKPVRTTRVVQKQKNIDPKINSYNQFLRELRSIQDNNKDKIVRPSDIKKLKEIKICDIEEESEVEACNIDEIEVNTCDIDEVEVEVKSCDNDNNDDDEVMDNICDIDEVEGGVCDEEDYYDENNQEIYYDYDYDNGNENETDVQMVDSDDKEYYIDTNNLNDECAYDVENQYTYYEQNDEYKFQLTNDNIIDETVGTDTLDYDI